MISGIFQQLSLHSQYGDVIKIDNSTNLICIFKLFIRSVVGGKHNVSFLHPIALESINSVMDEQSHPQPYSCRILIRNRFRVAFTAKNSLKPLFHAKASFKACAFSDTLLIIKMKWSRIFSGNFLYLLQCYKGVFFIIVSPRL